MELIDLVRELLSLNDDNLAERVIKDSDVQWCLSELYDFLEADAALVVHGRWIENGIKDSMLSKCSACGFSCGAYSFNYCPNCGARMDREVFE